MSFNKTHKNEIYYFKISQDMMRVIMKATECKNEG